MALIDDVIVKCAKTVNNYKINNINNDKLDTTINTTLLNETFILNVYVVDSKMFKKKTYINSSFLRISALILQQQKIIIMIKFKMFDSSPFRPFHVNCSQFLS